MRNLHQGLSRPKPNPREIPMRHFKQVQFEERFVMQKMIYSNKPVKETAELLKRDKSTVYREIDRNKTRGYHAQEINRIVEIIFEYQDYIEDKWNEYFKK